MSISIDRSAGRLRNRCASRPGCAASPRQVQRS